MSELIAPIITNIICENEMDMDTLVWLWIIGGGLLIASELFIPGMITFFLGLSAFVVALGYKFGFLGSVLSGFATWFITSLFSVFVLRELAQKLLPGDSTHKAVDEDMDAFGEGVEVLEDVRAADDKGRIKFRGTTWQATTGARVIPAGKKAKIVARDNLVWIVEPHDELMLDNIQTEDLE